MLSWIMTGQTCALYPRMISRVHKDSDWETHSVLVVRCGTTRSFRVFIAIDIDVTIKERVYPHSNRHRCDNKGASVPSPHFTYSTVLYLKSALMTSGKGRQ
jgi:hypothetical protein